jgi:hypothetical protein
MNDQGEDCKVVGVNPPLATSDNLLDNRPRVPTMSGSASPVSSEENTTSQPEDEPKKASYSTSSNLASLGQLQHESQEQRSIPGHGDSENNPATLEKAETRKDSPMSIANEQQGPAGAGSNSDSGNETMEEEALETECPNDGLEERLRTKDQTETDGSIGEEQQDSCKLPEARDRPPSVITTTTTTTTITSSRSSLLSAQPAVVVASKKLLQQQQQQQQQQGAANSLRRGKWTVEEEAYVARVIQDFNSGFLNAPAGTTLRTYLSEKLQCDPMRITKKFTGEACIGKRVFHPAVRSPSNVAAIDKAQVSSTQIH